MKWLVTGIDGFAGHHFYNFLKAKGDIVYGTSRRNYDNQNVFHLNLSNRTDIFRLIEEIKPDYLVLLAGFSSLRESFSQVEECMIANFHSSECFLQAISKNKLTTKVLLVSSAMVYSPSNKKLREKDPLFNNSPYTEAKIKQEQLMQKYPEVWSVCSRSFNHTGKGQKDSFVIPKIAKAFVEEQELDLGQIDTVRDFLDVIDISQAYHILLKEGKKHEIYNVCSGEGHSIKEIINILEEHTGKKIFIKTNPHFTNENERDSIIGENKKIIKETSWKPSINFKEMVINLYEFWKNTNQN